jgi:CheY-like chemotaxis protein
LLHEPERITQTRARVVLGADQILLAEADLDARVWLRTIVAGQFGLDEVDTGEAALDRIAAGTARIVIIGRWLTDMTGEELLARAARWLVPDRRTPVTFLLADPTGETPQVDDTQIPVFYRLVRGMAPSRVCELLTQAAAKLPPMPPREPDPVFAALVAEHAKAIGAATEPDDAARAAIAAVVELVGADRARCLYCDEESGLVWSGAGADESEAPVSSGIAGFAVRAVAGVVVPHAADDAPAGPAASGSPPSRWPAPTVTSTRC